MSTAFRNKAQQFAQQVISDVRPTATTNIQTLPSPADKQQQQQSIPAITTEPPAPSIDAAGGGSGGGGEAEPQAYHEESRLSEYGTKHIDPDTGLIYFKYDFGYEFGLVLPGQPQKVDKIETTIGKEGTIELPVIHEHTTPAPSPTPAGSVTAAAPAPTKQQQAPVTFKPRKFTQFKAAKWEPTTDSELSDQEASGSNKTSSQQQHHQHGRYYGERKQTFKSNSGNKLAAGSGNHSAAASAEERSPSPESMCSVSPSPEPAVLDSAAAADEKQKKL